MEVARLVKVIGDVERQLLRPNVSPLHMERMVTTIHVCTVVLEH